MTDKQLSFNCAKLAGGTKRWNAAQLLREISLPFASGNGNGA
jgi:hypothetical protein